MPSSMHSVRIRLRIFFCIVFGTADELIALMGNSAGWAGNYRLTDDIDLTGKSGQACIGNDTTPFTGIFDGNGKTVSGVSLRQFRSCSSQSAHCR